MEGRLGRIINKISSPFRGQSVESHYLTQPFYNRGRVLVLMQDPQLDEKQIAKAVVRQIRETHGILFQEAMIAGAAYELTPGKNSTHAKGAEYARRYMLDELRQTSEHIDSKHSLTGVPTIE